jgi:penicillin-binding protein 1A
MMKDVVQRGTAAGSVGSQIRFPAGGKTGTTNDGTNVWFLGYTQDLVAGVWMGFDKPAKIKANAQGGILAAPAWTSFMNEVYRRKPAPRDWPMPADIVMKQVDVSTNMLATPYCPREVVANEYYIPGTDPVQECTVHGPGLFPDTSGVGAPPGTYPASPYPIGGPPSADSLRRIRRAGVDTGRSAPTTVVPGAATPIRPGRSQPPDTSRRFRDSAIFALPSRDSLAKIKARNDSVRRADSLRVRPPKPDTSGTLFKDSH